MYYPRESSPTTVAEAVMYATYYYADSGWSAFINGWCFGHGMNSQEIANLQRPGRAQVIAWANEEIRKINEVSFPEGRIVILQRRGTSTSSWVGMRCRVGYHACIRPGTTFLEPLEPRPDGNNYEGFFWPTEYLKEA